MLFDLLLYVIFYIKLTIVIYIPTTSMWSFFLPLLLKAEILVVLVENCRSCKKLPLPSKKCRHKKMAYHEILWFFRIFWVKTLPGQRCSITVSLWVMDCTDSSWIPMSLTNQMKNKYQPLKASQLHSPWPHCLISREIFPRLVDWLCQHRMRGRAPAAQPKFTLSEFDFVKLERTGMPCKSLFGVCIWFPKSSMNSFGFAKVKLQCSFHLESWIHTAWQPC